MCLESSSLAVDKILIEPTLFLLQKDKSSKTALDHANEKAKQATSSAQRRSGRMRFKR